MLVILSRPRCSVNLPVLRSEANLLLPQLLKRQPNGIHSPRIRAYQTVQYEEAMICQVLHLRCTTLDECHLCESQQLGSCPGHKPIRKVIQGSCHHPIFQVSSPITKSRKATPSKKVLVRSHVPPIHSLAEFDHSGSEPLTSLRECLYCASRHFVFPCHNVYRNFSTQISKL